MQPNVILSKIQPDKFNYRQDDIVFFIAVFRSRLSCLPLTTDNLNISSCNLAAGSEVDTDEFSLNIQ